MSAPNYIYSPHHVTGALHVSDMIICVTKDALLVAPRDKAQDIKALIAQISQDHSAVLFGGGTVYRPWGHYTFLHQDVGVAVKALHVNAGAKLSLQKHVHRAEHWVVMEGVATVQRGDDTIILQENESIYVPKGVVHRIENATEKPLKVVEVQTGEHLCENDIIRLEDDFGRKNIPA